MIAKLRKQGWTAFRAEMAPLSARKLGYMAIVYFSRPSPFLGEEDDEMTVFV